MAVSAPGHGVDEAELAKYRLDIKQHWTAPEGESSEQASGFYYIPHFINEQEEEYLIEKVCRMACDSFFFFFCLR